jgi:uncharacterized protein (TIGR03067 family)
MRQLPVLLVVALVAAVAIGAEPKENHGADGTWVIAAMEMGGTKIPAEALKKEGAKLTLDGEKWTLKMGDEAGAGTSKVDATKHPTEMDITTTEGPHKGSVIKAIVERTSDTMKVCFDNSGNERPKEFSTKDKPTYILIEYSREKK